MAECLESNDADQLYLRFHLTIAGILPPGRLDLGQRFEGGPAATYGAIPILVSPNSRHRIDVSCHSADTRSQPGRKSRFRADLAVALFCILGMTEVTPSDWIEKEATHDTIQVIFDSLRFLLHVGSHDLGTPS